MRTALLALVLVACSRGTHQPRIDEVAKRFPGACQKDRSSDRRCTSDTLDVSVSGDSKDKDADPRVSQLDVTVHAATGDAAFAAVQPILDGFVPAAAIDGIRTRLTGPTAQRFDPSGGAVIDKVLVNAGSVKFGDDPTYYLVLVMYP